MIYKILNNGAVRFEKKVCYLLNNFRIKQIVNGVLQNTNEWTYERRDPIKTDVTNEIEIVHLFILYVVN